MGLKALLVVISCMIINVYGHVSSTQPPPMFEAPPPHPHHKGPPAVAPSYLPVKALVHPPANPPHPHDAPDTTTLAYWANWKVLLCSIWLFISLGIAVCLIWKYERPLVHRQRISRFNRTHDDVVLFDEDCWHCNWTWIHPSVLMILRVLCFGSIFVPIVLKLNGQGKKYFRFYSQWSFILSTIYFAMASVMSIYGCYQHHYNNGSKRIISVQLDQIPPILNDAERVAMRNQGRARPAAGFWGYTLQIVYQMQAAAVILSAFSYWFFHIPLLGTKRSTVEFGGIWMHSFFVFVLFMEGVFNHLGFPFFRIAYFLLWTLTYILFEWIYHACKKTWWPYFLYDLSSNFSPVWYLIVLIGHVPCYGAFWLVVKLKHKYL